LALAELPSAAVCCCLMLPACVRVMGHIQGGVHACMHGSAHAWWCASVRASVSSCTRGDSCISRADPKSRARASSTICNTLLSAQLQHLRQNSSPLVAIKALCALIMNDSCSMNLTQLNVPGERVYCPTSKKILCTL
jgi:hypothetical protein